MLSDVVFRLRSLSRRNTVEAELDDELRFHFEQQVEKCIRSELTAVIPASLSANLQPTAGGIQVFNPDGGHSGEAGFDFNALPPQIASISPSSTAANSSGFTLTVTGSNFNTSSWVTWNGANLKTTYVSATQLTALAGSAMMPGGWHF